MMRYCLLFCLLFGLPTYLFSQTNIIVPLKIKIGERTVISTKRISLPFEKDQITEKSPWNNYIKIERETNDANSFNVTIDDVKSVNHIKFIIKEGAEKVFTQRINFKNRKPVHREFVLIHNKDLEDKTDYFLMKANYTASGIFPIKNCETKLALFDVMVDGNFDVNDKTLILGSNLGIDRNNDGNFYGRGEWYFSNEIVELCGKNYLISNIAPTGSSMTLKQTNLQNVKLFQESPKFNFTLLNQNKLSSESLKGKPYLIDFWATWCVACIAKMPEIKQIEGRLPIIYFNTDKIDRKKDALKLIDRLGIFENSVLEISTGAKTFYKSYQRNYQGLPLYVLIDGNGIFRYGGSGGEDLKELKAEIEKLIK